MELENTEVKIKCYKCGEKFTSDQMRYNPNNPKQLVCRTCLERKSAPARRKKGDVTYYCVKCNFKFKRAEGKNVTSCPYCGKTGCLTTQMDTDSLLEEKEFV